MLKLFNINNHRTSFFQNLKIFFKQRFYSRVIANSHMQSANAHAGKSLCTQARGQIAFSGVSMLGRGIIFIASRHGACHHCCVHHRFGNRPGSVLGNGNRHHISARDETKGRLETNHPIGIGRADDRAIGFSANGCGGKRGCHGRAGTGGGAARGAVKIMRIAGLPTNGAPTANGIIIAKIGPFGKIGLAENNRTLGAQIGNQRRITASKIIFQSQRPGGGRHIVGGFNIIFHQNRNTMQGTATITFLAFRIQRPRHIQRIWVQGNNRIDIAIHSRNALQIGPHHLFRRPLTRLIFRPYGCNIRTFKGLRHFRQGGLFLTAFIRRKVSFHFLRAGTKQQGAGKEGRSNERR